LRISIKTCSLISFQIVIKILKFLKIKRSNEQTKQTSTIPPCGSLLRHLFFNFFSNSNKYIKISKNKKIKWANKTNLYGTPLRFSIKTCSLISFQIVIKILKFLKIKKNIRANKTNLYGTPLRFSIKTCSLIFFQIVIKILKFHFLKIKKNTCTRNKQNKPLRYPLAVLYWDICSLISFQMARGLFYLLFVYFYFYKFYYFNNTIWKEINLVLPGVKIPYEKLNPGSIYLGVQNTIWHRN
jgi:hypothetical protein